MAKLWFTSDWHLDHGAILVHEKSRPFKTRDEMNEAIIENNNRFVAKEDTVYNLGDLFFRTTKARMAELRQRINGRIHMIWGNHDDDYTKKIANTFESVQDMKYLRIDGERIHMCHYKLEVWRANNHGTWHIFGHSHGNLKFIRGRAIDVGIMQKGWNPDIPWLFTYEEIKEFMLSRPKASYHHDNNSIGLGGDGI